MKRTQHGKLPHWSPFSIRPAFLGSIVAISLLLIVTLQLLLNRSLANNGLLFAAEIHSLSVSTTFAYLYLPTVIAVCYGFAWTWIDIDIRRLEPYYQLSKDGGALGDDSLLLDYPVGFILAVPVQAARKGHWVVFLASFATLLALWGLTPSQAGIFAVSTVNRTIETTFTRSTGSLPLVDQPISVSAQIAQSVSNILWLNETLPPFMTREYVLAPFSPLNTGMGSGASESWTFVTQKYSANISCETPVYGGDPLTAPTMNSSWGCHMFIPDPRPISNIYDEPQRIFGARYMGYWNPFNSPVDNLQPNRCPPTANNTFITQWSKALHNGTYYSQLGYAGRLLNATVTNRYCRINYFVQDVRAVVSASPVHQVRGYTPVGASKRLPADFFNSTSFEIALDKGQEIPLQRGPFPTAYWPNQKVHWVNTDLHYNDFDPITLFALAALPRPSDEYLDPEVLDSAFQAAIQLLFARRIADLLSSDQDPRTAAIGHRTVTTQAVIMVPAFTYIAEILLGLISICGITLMIHLSRRRSSLKGDPSVIATLMKMSAEDGSFLEAFKHLDRSTSSQVRSHLKNCQFDLQSSSRCDSPVLRRLPSTRAQFQSVVQKADELPHNTAIAGVQPFGYSLRAGAAFVFLQIAAFAGVIVISSEINVKNGLPLPSRSEFTRRFLESYLPIALVTLLESFWQVLNRHCCTLKPFEVLRRGPARAEKSIGLDYAAVPPQFALLKAMKNRHYLLTLVCLMSFLANFLSIASSSLLYEDIALIPGTVPLVRQYRPLIQHINGSALPFTPDHEGTNDPFYIATSNTTASTPLPPWVDDEYFYLPFQSATSTPGTSETTRSTTAYFGANFECQAINSDGVLSVHGPFSNNLYSLDIDAFANLTITLSMNDTAGTNTTCGPRGNTNLSTSFQIDPFNGTAALEINEGLMTIDPNATQTEQDFCHQHMAAAWVRAEAEHVLTPLDNGLTNSSFDIRSWTATLIVCRLGIDYGVADLEVRDDGQIVKRHSLESRSELVPELFAGTNSTIMDLINQAYMFFPDEYMYWHRDDYSSDFMNYLIAAQHNDTSALDYRLPPPAPNIIIPRYEALFKKLFAIMLGHFAESLFVASGNGSEARIPASPTERLVLASKGTNFRSETRIFISPVFLTIAEVILGMYILTTLTLYLRRPWRILTRLPDSPASVIAYFAASRALTQLRSGSQQSKGSQTADDRNKLKSNVTISEKSASCDSLASSEVLYSFGTYRGTDGAMRLGIENAEFVHLLNSDRAHDEETDQNLVQKWVGDLRHQNRRKVKVAEELRRRSQRYWSGL